MQPLMLNTIEPASRPLRWPGRAQRLITVAGERFCSLISWLLDLALPHDTVPILMQTRWHVFVVRFCDVSAHKIRGTETFIAESAHPFVADEGVRSPLGIRWVCQVDVAFSDSHKVRDCFGAHARRRATIVSAALTSGVMNSRRLICMIPSTSRCECGGMLCTRRALIFAPHEGVPEESRSSACDWAARAFPCQS
jgi:hypothetical protein